MRLVLLAFLFCQACLRRSIDACAAGLPRSECDARVDAHADATIADASIESMDASGD